MVSIVSPFAIALLVLFGSGEVLAAQVASEAVARALEYRRLGEEVAATTDSTSAIRMLEAMAEAFPGDGRTWLALGRRRMAAGQSEATVDALGRAMALGELGAAEGQCLMARALVGQNDDAAAIALQQCLEDGYRFRDATRRDPGLAQLFERPSLQPFSVPAASACVGTDGWRLDLAYLVSELERVHYSVRVAGLPTSFLTEVDSLTTAIPQLSDAQVFLGMQRLLASFRDGHTVAYPIGMRRGFLTHMPLGLWLFEDGPFVVTASGPHQDLIGSRVVRLAGHTVDTLVARLAKYASHDNPSGLRWVAPAYLSFVEVLQLLGADPTAGVVVERPGGARDSLSLPISPRPAGFNDMAQSLPAPPAVEAPLYLRASPEPFLVEQIADQMLYVRLDRIANAKGTTLAVFGRGLSEQLAVDRPAAVVLDLRRNPGGDAALLPELVRALVRYDATGTGRLYVLTSRNTFSAAQTLVNLLEQLTLAVFVGEPPGTSPNRLGNEAPFALPCSGVLGSISSGYNQGASSRDERVWVPPDVPVGLNSADYFGGRDPVLETVLALERRRRG